ncbi:ACP phosphodiesterase [Porticoccaceae bacterium LTM1]|nr:ACP phosphodiesterase [Porticoccaceae bacterium LTM1]
MNYLAHLFLSGDEPQVMIGGLLGDFVKGPLRGEYPTDIERGIALHRYIDAWVDDQPEMLAAVQRFHPPFRRFGGVIVDICYDHLLAKRWSDFHAEALGNYAKAFYSQLQQHYNLLPDRAQRFADTAPVHRLLEGYANEGAIELALNRISRRLKRPVNLAGAMPSIHQHWPALEREFETLFPRLCVFADSQLRTL